MGTTLAQIAARAGVSPGLVAHYFGDKDGLLDAAFRSLARRVGNQVRTRLRQVEHAARAHSGGHRRQSRAGGIRAAHRHRVAGLLGSGAARRSRLKRVQSVYQRRTLSNLRSSLKKLVPPGRGAEPGGDDRRDDRRRVAARRAVRMARGGQRERARLADRIRRWPPEAGGTRRAAPATRRRERSQLPVPRPASDSRRSIRRPARCSATSRAAGRRAGQCGGARRAQARSRVGARMTGAERARVLRRAADILRSRNQELAELETRDTGKPIQETRGGGRGLRRRLLRIFRRPRAEPRAASTSIWARRPSATRGASRSAWSPASAPGTIRCRSPAGRRRRRWPAATP